MILGVLLLSITRNHTCLDMYMTKLQQINKACPLSIPYRLDVDQAWETGKTFNTHNWITIWKSSELPILWSCSRSVDFCEAEQPHSFRQGRGLKVHYCTPLTRCAECLFPPREVPLAWRNSLLSCKGTAVQCKHKDKLSWIPCLHLVLEDFWQCNWDMTWNVLETKLQYAKF